MRQPRSFPADPPANCPLCPRLVAYRHDNAAREPKWFNGAVGSFGAETASLLIVGLAPGRTGANRTGRPFTGDWAGDLLYQTLAAKGLSRGSYAKAADDGLTLVDTMITNAVRCAPPQNKPTGEEIRQCEPFLSTRLRTMPRLSVVVALGKIAHDSVVRCAGQKLSAFRFAHGAEHRLTLADRALVLIDSYHCSRYNTSTKRLTADMFAAVFDQAKRYMR